MKKRVFTSKFTISRALVRRVLNFRFIITTAALILLFVSSATAQFFRIASRPVQPEMAFWQNNANRGPKEVDDRLYYKTYNALGDFDGTPYVLDSLSSARVVDIQGDVFEVRYFNIDAYSDQFVVSKTNNIADEDYIWLNKKDIDYVVVADISGEAKVNRYYKNIEFIDESLGICEVLFNGEEIGIQVYRKPIRRFVDARKGTNIVADKPARFGKSEDIYIYKEKEGLKKIKNQKAFIKLFGDNQKKVKSLIKEMKLDYRNPLHLDNIFTAFPDLSVL